MRKIRMDAAILAAVLLTAACAQSSTLEHREAAFPDIGAQQVLPDGLYSVCTEAKDRKQSCHGASDRVFLVEEDEKNSDGSPRKVALDLSSYVPLVLEGEPLAGKDRNGRTLLSVTLAPTEKRALETFTRAHLGGRVAIVLERHVMTTHKVRSVIDGGKMQITRCTDERCSVIQSKLESREGSKP